MPLPGTRVIHPRWSERHRPTASGTLTSTCVITRRTGAGTTGPTGTFTPAAAATIYTGPCRVVVAQNTSERLLVRGDAEETHRRYQVSIRYDADDLQVGDLVTITAAVDPHLAGKGLRVIDVRYGSEQWERDLICDELEG